MKKSEHQRYVREMEAMFLRVGAVPTPERRLEPGEKYLPSQHRDFCLQTKFGPLGLNVGNRESEVWGGSHNGSKVCFWPDVFGCFDDPKAAVAGGMDANPYSGKWNHMWSNCEAAHIDYIVAKLESKLKQIALVAVAA